MTWISWLLLALLIGRELENRLEIKHWERLAADIPPSVSWAGTTPSGEPIKVVDDGQPPDDAFPDDAGHLQPRPYPVPGVRIYDVTDKGERP